MYADETLSGYLDRAASAEPIPGGGSVAALVGALGASMASMACNFTVGRKKYSDVEGEVSGILRASEEARAALLQLAGLDSEAYSAVSAAYKLPRETEEEKAARREAIQCALERAMDAPLGTMRRCAELLRKLHELGQKGNPNLVSDVGVCAILLEAALRAALLNVEINLRELKDAALVEKVKEEVERLTEQACKSAEETLALVRSLVSRG